MAAPVGDPVARFRCPQCGRALRVPERAIGKRIGCPFCQTLYDTSFAIIVEPKKTPDAPATSQTAISRWAPSTAVVSNAAGSLSKMASSVAGTGAQAARNAASAVSDTTKRAAAAALPIVQGVSGIASAVLPGTGEILNGRFKQGSCTLAAFLGATAAAGATTAMGAAALATPAGAVIVAVPVAIRVFSAWQGAKLAKRSSDLIQQSIHESLTSDEASQIGEEARRKAESISDEEFERLILDAEEKELAEAEAQPVARRIVLKRVEPIVECDNRV